MVRILVSKQTESTEDCRGVDKSKDHCQFRVMLHLPAPLHSFAVHFPVVFLLLGCVGIALSLLWPNRRLMGWVMLSMLCGAAATSWAHATGMVEASQVRYVGATAAVAVQDHKNISDLMLLASWIAALATVVVFFGVRISGVSLLARLVSLAAGVFLLWSMQATLHTGSELTHTYFFGPNAPKPLLGTEEVVRLRLK